MTHGSSLRTPHSALGTRRNFLQAGMVGLGVGTSGWFQRLAAAAEGTKPKKACILLWLNGGPSTIDLWDLKPGHDNGGPYKEIEAAPGLRIGEHLPKLAKHGKHLAVVRGMTTKEGDHGRASYLMRTGNLPMGGVQFPSVGGLLAKELGTGSAELPDFVSVGPQRFFNQEAYGPGFLGPKYAPLIVADGGQDRGGGGSFAGIDEALKVQNLGRPKEVTADHAAARMELLKAAHEDFGAQKPSGIATGHAAAYDRAARLMQSDAGKVFDLSTEKAEVRERYGKTLFGQGCLLARRLVEKDVPFVEVTLGGWDTHQNNFDLVKTLCGSLDAGWSALMTDLADRGRLDDTLIICMGEFGRTPKINPTKGRDHYPNAWAVAMAGGGLQGGRAVGSTSKDGSVVEERPTGSIDLLATACQALGVDWKKPNMSNIGRPIAIVDKAADPLTELL